MPAIAHKQPKSTFATILLTGLLTGTLDGSAAIIWGYKISPAIIFKYIASGVFGKAAFAGGTVMVIWGVFFHYIIALSFTAVLFLLYPRVIAAIKNKYATAVIYALITWLVTNLVIVPLSQIGWKPIGPGAVLIGIGILIITIGLPVALIADSKVRRHS